VEVDRDACERAVSSLARCALRHGGFEQVQLAVRGAEIGLTPVTPASAPVLLGDDLRDLGAAVAVRVVRARGGTVEVDGDVLTIRLGWAGRSSTSTTTPRPRAISTSRRPTA